MKTFLKLLGLLLIAFIGFHIWMNWPVRLAVPDNDSANQHIAHSQAPLKLTLLRSGHIESLHAMNVRGGDWQPYNSGVMAVLIEHPKGRYLIDAGFGRNVQAHFLTTPALMQKVAKLQVTSDTLSELAKLGLQPADIDGILLTHAHWDHSSGFEDMLEVPVLAPAEEIAFIRSGNEHAALAAQWADQLIFKAVEFADKPRQGFERSLDLFGDNSVVLVPMAGHTPGSMGIFVNRADGQSLLFAGDSSWTKEGIDWPAEKPFVAKHLVEHDAEAVAELLVQLHQLQAANPQLTIVPAHDERIYPAISDFNTP